MRSIIVFLISGAFLLSFSCATVPTEPLAKGELRLLGIEVAGAESIYINLPFMVKIIFQAEGETKVQKACFYWSGDGPYCYRITDVRYGPQGTINVWLLTKNPGTYQLECFVQYARNGGTRPTNIVSTQLIAISRPY